MPIKIFSQTMSFAALMFISISSASSDQTSLHKIDPKNGPMVKGGQKIYSKHCAVCHGKNLEGQANWRQPNPNGTLPAPPHDETGHTWHHPDLMLFQVTKQGGQAFAPPTFKSSMPAFSKQLTDQDIWAVLSFIKSKWPKHIQNKHDRINGRMHHMNK